MSKEKLSYIDYFRAIAIIFIVLGHTMLWGRSDLKYFNVLFFSGWTFSFVFIAGFLFQYLSYKFEYKEYLKKKFTNVIMPYLITLTPVALLMALTVDTAKHPFFQFAPPVRLISAYLGGYIIQAPLWFVGMISFMFLLAPVLLFLKNNKKLWYIVLFLSFIYSSFLTQRPQLSFISNHGWFVLILSMIGCYLKYLAYFLFAYLIGMELSTLFEKHHSFIKQHSTKFLSVLIPIWAILFIIVLDNFQHIGRYQTILKCLSAFIALLLLFKFEDKIKNSAFWHKSLLFIANYSFGIFFIHKYFVNIIKKHSFYQYTKHVFVNVNSNTFESFAISVGIFLIAFFGSIIVLYTIKKILNKFGITNTRKFIGV